MSLQSIVVTTIYSPTQSILQFAKMHDFSLFVSGDNKTPKNWHVNDAKFISILDQKKKYAHLSRIVSQNHYARKNFAYLEAIASGAEYIFDTDDDNFPNNLFPNFILKAQLLEQYRGNIFINVYSLFTKQHVWSRGLPLSYVNELMMHKSKRIVRPLIQQSLADLDPDVDAIYRLTNGKVIRFQKQKIISLAKGTYSPFNSQSTYWNKEAFPLLYLPSTVNSRITDIWRGYIAQKILWQIGSRLIFLSPCVYQKRNVHDLMKDFRDELDLYLKTEKMVLLLDRIKLSGTISDMMMQIYREFIKYSFFKKEELKALKVWLSYFKKPRRP